MTAQELNFYIPVLATLALAILVFFVMMKMQAKKQAEADAIFERTMFILNLKYQKKEEG